MSKNKTIQLEEVLKNIEKKFKSARVRGLVFRYVKRFIFALLAVAFTGGVSYAGYTFYASNSFEDNYDKITDGIVIDMNLSENNYASSTKTFTDNSGLGNDGVSISTPVFVVDNYGNETGAMSFNGTSDLIEVSSGYFGYNTFSAWFNTSSSTEQIIAGGFLGYQYYSLALYNQKLSIAGASGSEAKIQTINTYNKNKWYHVVVVRTENNFPNEFIIYVNGVEQSIEAGGTHRASGGAYIGARIYQDQFSLFFQGSIASVKVFNRIISSDEVALLYNSSKSGLVLDLDLSEDNYNSSTKTFKDNSRLGNHGTSINAVNFSADKNGGSNRAMSFDGTSDYINAGNDDSTSITGEITISTWIYYVPQLDGNPTIVSKHMDGCEENWWSSSTYALGITSNSVNTIRAGFNGGNIGSTTELDYNKWYHLALTYEGFTASLYIDGALDKTETQSFTDISNTQDLIIGSRKCNTSEGYEYTGDISSVKIYNKALSANEINNLYNSSKPKLNSSSREKVLVGHWPLDRESEKTSSDINSNGDFEIGVTTDWSSYFNALDGASGLFSAIGSGQYKGSYSGKVNIIGSGDGSSDIQIINSPFSMETGKMYKLTFAIKSDFTLSTDPVITVIKDVSPFTNYGLSRYFSVSTEWQKYEYYFTSTGTDSNVRIDFFLGNVGTGNIYLDNVSLKEVETADATVYENHGTVYGATSTTDRMGRVGGAMEFDGVDDYVDMGNNNNLDLATEGTVGVWIKVPSVWIGGDYPNIVSKGANSGWDTGGWSLYGFSNDRIGIGMRNGDTTFSHNFTNTVKDQWTYIVGTWDSSTVKLYQDGVFQSSEPQTISPELTTTSAKIGLGNHYWGGDISDVRVYNRALSADEISSMYGSYRPKLSTGSLKKGLILDLPLKKKNEKLGSNMLVNGNMESGDPPSGWTHVVDTNNISVSDDSTNDPGIKSMEGVKSADNNWVAHQSVTLENVKLYRMSGWVKNIDATYGSIIAYRAENGVLGIEYNSLNQWSHLSFDFNGVADDTHSIAFSLSGTGGQKARLDNVALREVMTSDETPYSNHGYIYGATVATSSMEFDGVDDYVDSGDLGNIGDEFTYSAWFKTLSTGDYNMILSVDGKTNGNPQLRTRNGLVQFRFYDGNSLQTVATYNDNNWHLATGGINSDGDYFLYVDGVDKGTLTPDKTLSWSGSTRIAKYDHNDGIYFDGSISGVRIYNRELSAEEIELLYSKGR